MDISNLARQDTKFFPLLNPEDGKPFIDDKTKEEVGVTMAALSSSIWKNKWRELSKDVQERATKNELTEDDTALMLAAATVEVHHLSLGKKKLTPDNIVELYKNDDYSWYRDDLMNKIVKDQNFLKKPMKD